MAGKSILDINELGIDFGGLHALDEFSLNIQPADILGSWVRTRRARVPTRL